jgi:putative adhesin
MPSRRMVALSLSTLVVIGVAACSSVSNGRPTTGTSATASGSAQNGGTYQLPTTVTSLGIDGDAVAIDVTAAESAKEITVREKLHGRATTTKDVTSSSATLTAKCPSGLSFGVGCSVDYTVTMPARVTLNVDGTAGDMKLIGPFANATISTKAGRVEGTWLGAGTYEVTTNAGEVNLKFASPPNSVKVKSDVGEVVLTVPGGTKYAVTTETTVAVKNIDVDQDSSSTHRIDVTTTVGAVTINNG